jgi:hypothetical protein
LPPRSRRSLQVVGIEDALYVVADLVDWVAYPISRGDLERMAINIT